MMSESNLTRDQVLSEAFAVELAAQVGTHFTEAGMSLDDANLDRNHETIALMLAHRFGLALDDARAVADRVTGILKMGMAVHDNRARMAPGGTA